MGAGAGIEVPLNTKLTITGSGTLYVNGGNATNGADGGQGGGAVITDESYWYTTSGSGGLGGNGGGGAGAGIGGKGGYGGIGGRGAAGVTDNWKGSYKQSGTAGNPGGNGNQGQACGAVEICGAVTVIAKGGSSASRGGYGGAYSGREIAEGSTWYGAAYGGGGGGGGGGGVAASDIGGGGGGGGAGGGGGSGGICYFDDVDTVLMCKLNGDGGNGGKGVVGNVGLLNDYSGGFFTLFKDNQIWPGEETSAKINTVPYSTYTPGAGGAGGEAGATGGNGSLTVESTASCICGTRSAYNVGKISDTEYIRWENEKLWRVKDGVYTGIDYETVQNWTSNLDGGKWYVVKGSVHRADTINVGEGEPANLVLLDCAELRIDCGSNRGQTGIWVPQGRALNIFGVESGSLTAIGGCYTAGIGGGNKETMGTLTIYGGTVSATGGQWGAGIGSGNKAVGGGTVTINGGVVTAQGGEDAGAGIGGGDHGNGSDVTINGGSVTAYAGNKGAQSIGKGDEGANSGSLTLAPCVFKIDDNNYREEAWVSFAVPPTLRVASVTAIEGSGSVKTRTQNGVMTVGFKTGSHVTVKFALIDPDSHFADKDSIELDPFSSKILEASSLPQVIENIFEDVEYMLPSGETNEAHDVRIVHQTDVYGTKLSDGWYVVTETVTRAALEVSGVVNLILADGAKLTVNQGIQVTEGNELNIFCQSAGTGQLIATGGEECAGIGGSYLIAGGTVTINGGEITAIGGDCGAGIGGGNRGAGGTVTINGGTVTATSVNCGAGIGGGYRATGGTIIINGGTVKATGVGGSTGIGGGMDASAGEVTINGGDVTAIGNGGGAGIGGGRGNPRGGDGGIITINGGVVTATGKEGGAGIGGGAGYSTGDGGAGGTVTINGGTVMATAENGGAGIGGGDGGAYYNPRRQGAPGTVTLDEEKVEVVDGMYGNDYSYVKITKIQDGPACEGGAIKLVDGVWVVTPNEGVTEVKIRRLPEGEAVVVPPTISKVVGVEDEQIRIFDGESYITDFFSIEDGVITQIVLTVTMSGDMTNLTAEWTSGNGAATNAVENGSFEVGCGSLNVKVIFTPTHNYQFKSESEDGVRALTSPLIESCTVTAPEVEGIPGTEVAPWQVGDEVTAYVSDEKVLVIGGEGAMDDFADVNEVPWTDKAKEIKSVTIAEGVTQIGAKSWEGLSDTVTINGVVLSAIKLASTGLNISAEPVIPEDMVLVTKESITAAKATTISVENNEVKLGVSVRHSDDITAEPTTWEELESVIITIPVKSKQGFMILRSGEGK